MKANLPVQGLIRATVFDHFCGGVSEEDCMPVVDKMYVKRSDSSVLDYSVEGKEEEAQFDAVLEKTITATGICRSKRLLCLLEYSNPQVLVEVFGLAEKRRKELALTPEEEKEWERIEERFEIVCKKAYDCDVALLNRCRRKLDAGCCG